MDDRMPKALQAAIRSIPMDEAEAVQLYLDSTPHVACVLIDALLESHPGFCPEYDTEHNVDRT